jgi:hypothetical protein
MVESSRTYLPAAGRDWLLPLYDPFVKLLGGDAARRALLDEASSTWAAARARWPR